MFHLSSWDAAATPERQSNQILYCLAPCFTSGWGAACCGTRTKVPSSAFLPRTSVFTSSTRVLSFSPSFATDLACDLSKSLHCSVSLSLWIRPGWIKVACDSFFVQESHKKMPSLVGYMLLITAVEHLESYCWETAILLIMCRCYRLHPRLISNIHFL